MSEEAVVKVDIDAGPEDVWDALTTEEGLAAWIGVGSTIGGEPGQDLYLNDVVTGEQKRGVLDEVTPHRRLGYTWWPETALSRRRESRSRSTLARVAPGSRWSRASRRRHQL